MKIAGLQKVSLIDFPDRVAATVFVAGCNLDCGFCHNRWMIAQEQVDAVTTPSELVAWLTTRRGRLDGVCLTGGEPLASHGLAGLVRRICELQLGVKLDTNGTYPRRLEQLLNEGLLDYVAMDVKAPLDARYAETVRTPVVLEDLQQSMMLLRKAEVDWEFRTTVHPLMSADWLRDLAHQLEPSDTWVLQPFEITASVAPAVAALPALSVDEITALLPELSELVPSVRLRGA